MSKMPLSQMIASLEDTRLGFLGTGGEPIDPVAYQKAIDSLRWMEKNSHCMQAAVAIMKDEAVKAVLETWPDAQIAAVRDVGEGR
jgi:hypothetical protein